MTTVVVAGNDDNNDHVDDDDDDDNHGMLKKHYVFPRKSLFLDNGSLLQLPSTSSLSVVVDAFVQNGFVVLRNIIDRNELQHVWYPYANNDCFPQCFQILYENGQIAAPTDRWIRKDEITYTLQQGLKHGFAELVMRSPGRYEISLKHLLQQQRQQQQKQPVHQANKDGKSEQSLVVAVSSLPSRKIASSVQVFVTTSVGYRGR